MPNSGKFSFKEVLKNFFKKFYFIKNYFKQKLFANFCGFKKKNGFDKQTDLDQKLIKNLSKKRLPNFKQLKYLKQVLNKEEKSKLKFLSMLLSGLLVVLFINLYFTADLIPRNGGSYTEGLVGTPKLINPLYASLNSVDEDLSRLIYSGLVKIDNQLEIVPDLAENWFISDDQKTYTFILRDDIKWHDGEKLDIDDVLFTFRALQNPEFKSPLASGFQNVKIEKTNETTFQFQLNEAYSPFLESLTIGILPEHIWQQVVPANALLTDYNLRPIGAGPFKFRSLTKDKLGNIKSYGLVKNKEYYNKPAYLDSLNFKFYPDFNTAVEALKNHNIDGLNYLPKELKKEINSRKDLNYYSLQLPQYTALFFNSANSSALKNINFKKALAHALDKQEIINTALQTEGQVIDGPILPNFIGYNPKIEKYEYNLEKANQLLNELGYVKSENEEFRKKGENELILTITTINKGENYLVSQIIQKMWQAVGIKTELRLIEANIIKSEIIKKRDFEILVFGQIVGIDPDPYVFWHSSQTGESGLNLSNFINREADTVLVEARKISDPQKKHDKYIHFQNILNQNLPAIFLYAPKYLYPVTNNIRGIHTQNISSPPDRFSNVTNWYVKTRRSL